MGFRRIIFLFGVVLLAVVPLGCFSEAPSGISSPVSETAPSPVHNDPTATVVVSTDFGVEILLEGTVDITSNTTALAALEDLVAVETKYGGGFVSVINGISSEYGGGNWNKKDWFFYINGFSSNTGASDYLLQDGDIEHWDFHDWSFRQFIPGIIGDFPATFLNGYGGEICPTVVCYQDGWEESARMIAEYLNSLGVDGVSIRSAEALTAGEKESGNLILLGTADFPLINEMNQLWKKLGFFSRFEDGNLEVYNGVGELDMEYTDGAGVIQAAQNPWNTSGTGVCENTVWMISGLDKSGVESAVDTLVSQSNDFRYAFGVVAIGGEIIRVPR